MREPGYHGASLTIMSWRLFPHWGIMPMREPGYHGASLTIMSWRLFPHWGFFANEFQATFGVGLGSLVNKSIDTSLTDQALAH